ncbi:MAG: HNH endonuclease [Variovorax paradoxus]|uniref:HNH endonuclease n=1 Tax=Variovorax paradoxus TaxID=34073 RepID=A0A2W5QNP1_VARPD|nr:MAG: HNH endonuclease [Variovorax paradoxus]
MTVLTVERLRELLHYDPETGVFTWTLQPRRRALPRGNVAGTVQRGRVQIIIDQKSYRAHRLAWLYMKGEWPSNEIDHIDGNGLNNKFGNLRDVSTKVNQQNKRRPKAGTHLGVQGVNKVYRRFRAKLHVEGRSLHLGYFSTPEEAHAAYVCAKRQLHAGCTI